MVEYIVIILKVGYLTSYPSLPGMKQLVSLGKKLRNSASLKQAGSWWIFLFVSLCDITSQSNLDFG